MERDLQEGKDGKRHERDREMERDLRWKET